MLANARKDHSLPLAPVSTTPKCSACLPKGQCKEARLCGKSSRLPNFLGRTSDRNVSPVRSQCSGIFTDQSILDIFPAK